MDEAEPKGRARRALLAHPVVTGALALILLGGGAFAAQQIREMIDPPYQNVGDRVPVAPKLTAGEGEKLFRIDPSRSKVEYRIGERIVGASASTAVGTTKAVAGDIAWNSGTPSDSRVGRIVIDVEQLRSDSTLRDARIRSDYLESHAFPLARFDTTSLSGLPATVEDGKDVKFTMAGDLEVKAKARPVTFDATGRLDNGELTVTATAKVKLSDFGIGPISIVGLVSTDDEAELKISLTAVDPATHEIPTTLTAAEAVATKGGGPSFDKAVRPILETNCSGCHTTGQIGADVWKLDTAGDASKFASGIATVTKSKYMPPWPASKKGIPLQHPRDLDKKSLATLASWAEHGGQLDVESTVKLEPAPAPSDTPNPRADLVLPMAEPYAGDGTQTNDYRCFALDPGFTKPTYVTGYSFEPGTRQVTHHALVYKVSEWANEPIASRDGEDGRPGWQCFVGVGVRSGSELFAGWVPGQRPLDFGDDRGFLFEPGDKIIMQIHYHYSGGVLADRSKLILQTDKPSPTMRALQVAAPIAPVEMPCPAAANGPLCDRAASIAETARLYGPMAAGIPDSLLRCGEENITQDPVTGNATGACDGRIATDGDIIDVLGHMHTLGKAFRMTLNPGTPQEKILLDIPTWNFEWQLNYQPVDPVPAKRGDVIRIECSWDRALRYDPNPKYIVFSEGTEDEMCFSTYTIDPKPG